MPPHHHHHGGHGRGGPWGVPGWAQAPQVLYDYRSPVITQRLQCSKTRPFPAPPGIYWDPAAKQWCWPVQAALGDTPGRRTAPRRGRQVIVEEPRMGAGEARCCTCNAPVDADGGFQEPQGRAACCWDCARIENEAHDTHLAWRPLTAPRAQADAIEDNADGPPSWGPVALFVSVLGFIWWAFPAGKKR